ncbi:V-set and immunoglobulin domain-containing protein 4-like isoform X2 [Stegostoma tigrinum]|uniref:V-set and immunoglobulin domain-containing protein 4-like isoform X2 n=1 Tax=Stegostoma tigrinum TaxID=3053191 RepID=UPI00202AE24A|nr:V-set and immunoglobulin domain-containing protein 4-like isoform X2 [Stegostoma tigrinum]
MNERTDVQNVQLAYRSPHEDQLHCSVQKQALKADSLTLTVPEVVIGQLRNSVNIPCTYHPSPLHVEVEVTWYINTYTIIIRRRESGSYIPLSNNRGRIYIQHGPGSGDVSLILKNLAYSDRGTYTCEVKWQTKQGLNQTEETADVSLMVQRALPSTRPPAALSPVVTSACGFNSAKIEVWVFALTVSLIVLIFSVIIICIVLWKRTKTEHINDLPSATQSFLYQTPTHVVISGNNEYETMTTMKENEYSVISVGSTYAYAQPNASV